MNFGSKASRFNEGPQTSALRLQLNLKVKLAFHPDVFRIGNKAPKRVVRAKNNPA